MSVFMKERNHKKISKANRFLAVWNLFGIVVVAGFFVYTLIIGGSAVQGYTENNCFYVSNHGTITLVPEAIWEISYLWEILFWVFLPLTPVGCFLISYIDEKIRKRKTGLE